MGGLLALVVIIVAVVVVKKKIDKKNVNSVSGGKYETEIKKLQDYYSIIRQNADALGASVIVISTYMFVLNGQVDSSSSFLAVGVRGGENKTLAEQLGMEVENLNGEIEYRFVLKGGYNRSIKRAILSEMANRIGEKYPNDVVKYDSSIPALYCMIDVKDIMEMLGN